MVQLAPHFNGHGNKWPVFLRRVWKTPSLVLGGLSASRGQPGTTVPIHRTHSLGPTRVYVLLAECRLVSESVLTWTKRRRDIRIVSVLAHGHLGDRSGRVARHDCPKLVCADNKQYRPEDRRDNIRARVTVWCTPVLPGNLLILKGARGENRKGAAWAGSPVLRS